MTTQQTSKLQSYLNIANMGVLSWALITLVTIYRDSAVDHERIENTVKVIEEQKIQMLKQEAKQDEKNERQDAEITKVWAFIDRNYENITRSRIVEQEERPKKY